MDVAEPVLGLAERTTETGAIVLLIALFLLFFAPVIRLFGARAFSFADSMALPVFGVYRRPVNRLYFFQRDFSRPRGRSRRRRRTSGGTTGRRYASGFFIASIVVRIVSHCSCAGGFFPVPSRRCIVFRSNFPLQIACICFCPRAFRPTRWTRRPARCLIGAASRPKAQCRPGDRSGSGSFGAAPKTVELIPVLKLEIVQMGRSPSTQRCFGGDARRLAGPVAS